MTVEDKYSLPLTEKQLDRPGADQCFITLDLAFAFYQVPVAPDSIVKAAFVTADNHLEFTRMLFTLLNAPAVYQRLMNNVLRPLKSFIGFPYIDHVMMACSSTTVGRNIKYLGREITV